MSSIYQMFVSYSSFGGERLLLSNLAHIGGHQPEQVGNSISQSCKEGRKFILLC